MLQKIIKINAEVTSVCQRKRRTVLSISNSSALCGGDEIDGNSNDWWM